MSPGKKKSVWFLGTSAFAVPSVETLMASDDFSVDLVITQPDRPVGRKQALSAPPVKQAAERHALTVVQPENINKEDSLLSRDRPDFLVVVSFGQILSQAVLDLPRIAPVNVHASLLPRWRGASPIHHAILAGDSETGVTIQKMVKELDAGPILAQEKLMIDPRETVTTLSERLAPMGANLLIKTLCAPLHPAEQDAAMMTVCHKLRREDGVVDPQTMTAEAIDRRVRGLTPWPGVTAPLNGQTLKLLETSLVPTPDSAPLPCAQGTLLHLVSVQPAGGKPMSGAAWMRGRKTA